MATVTVTTNNEMHHLSKIEMAHHGGAPLRCPIPSATEHLISKWYWYDLMTCDIGIEPLLEPGGGGGLFVVHHHHG